MVKETRSQRAARLERLMESFRRDRALQGDFSDTWAPTVEDVGAASSRNDDVFSNYIRTFELCDETVEGYPQE